MEVLLLKDVDNLGYAGDVKKVANGFGRNYLLPQHLAVLASSGALKQAETIRKAAEKQRATEMEDAKAISGQLDGLHLLFERRAGDTGKLYGSVTSGDIAEAIFKQTDIELDKRKVALAEPIRSLGVQKVILKLMIDLSITISAEVLPLGGILERARLNEAKAATLAAEAAKAEKTKAAETAITPVKVAPEAAEEASVEEASVEETSAEETSAEETSAEEASVEEVTPEISEEQEEQA